MKKLFFPSILLTLLMSSWLGAFSGNSWQDQSVVIYHAPDPLAYGIAADVSQHRLRDLYDFGLGLSQDVFQYDQSGFLTATLIDTQRIAELEQLFTPPNYQAGEENSMYSSITFDEHQLYRITHVYRYSQFGSQATSFLESPHYLYHNLHTGMSVEFSFEATPVDLLLQISGQLHQASLALEQVEEGDSSELAMRREQLLQLYLTYQRGKVIRIHQVNRLSLQGYSQIEDVMFAATLLGAKNQPMQGVPEGNDHLKQLISTLQSHPQMTLFALQAH
jgi:hypothetical protein